MAEQGHDFLVIEIGVGVGDGRVELGEAMQHQPVELGHVGLRDAVACLKMGQGAEHPADGVAQLAIGLDEGLQDLRPDAQIVRIIRSRHPEPQNVGAGILDDALRRDHVAEGLRHLLALLVENEAMGQNHVIGRAAARAAALQKRGMEPAAMLVRAFQIHDLIGPAIADAMGGQIRALLQREAVGRA